MRQFVAQDQSEPVGVAFNDVVYEVVRDPWPPKLDVISSQTNSTRFEGAGKYNAFASAEDCIPRIRITDDQLANPEERSTERRPIAGSEWIAPACYLKGDSLPESQGSGAQVW